MKQFCIINDKKLCKRRQSNIKLEYGIIYYDVASSQERTKILNSNDNKKEMRMFISNHDIVSLSMLFFVNIYIFINSVSIWEGVTW